MRALAPTGAVSLSFAEAKPIGLVVHHALKGVTERGQIVGALRRHASLVSVIEVLVLYKMTPPDLTGRIEPMVADVHDALKTLGEIVSVGTSRLIVRHKSGVDIQCVPLHAATTTWAWATLAATGPFAYVDAVRRGLAANGYQISGEAVYAPAAVGAQRSLVALTDEAELTALAGVAYRLPQARRSYTPDPAPVGTQRP